MEAAVLAAIKAIWVLIVLGLGVAWVHVFTEPGERVAWFLYWCANLAFFEWGVPWLAALFGALALFVTAPIRWWKERKTASFGLSFRYITVEAGRNRYIVMLPWLMVRLGPDPMRGPRLLPRGKFFSPMILSVEWNPTNPNSEGCEVYESRWQFAFVWPVRLLYTWSGYGAARWTGREQEICGVEWEWAGYRRVHHFKARL